MEKILIVAGIILITASLMANLYFFGWLWIEKRGFEKALRQIYTAAKQQGRVQIGDLLLFTQFVPEK